MEEQGNNLGQGDNEPFHLPFQNDKEQVVMMSSRTREQEEEQGELFTKAKMQTVDASVSPTRDASLRKEEHKQSMSKVMNFLLSLSLVVLTVNAAIPIYQQISIDFQRSNESFLCVPSTSTTSRTSTNDPTTTSLDTPIAGDSLSPTAHWTFNGTFTERLKGWTLKEMVGNVSFTSDRNRRANSALSLTKGYIMTSNCPTPYTVLSAALWVYVISVPSDYMGMFYWRTYYGELFIMRYNGSLINNNIWTHVGFTLDCLDQGCNVNLYLNGHVTFIDKLQLPITQLDYGTCYIGGNQYGWKFNGYIDDLMAWNKTLTPTEMIAVKNDYL